MNYEQLEEFLKNTYDEYDCVEVDKDDDVILIEEGDWINEGKYEYQESIFSDKEKTVFCSVVIGRSGSYFTDWEYADPHYFEVVPKEIKKTIYVAKK